MIDSRVRDVSFITQHFIEVLNLSVINFFYYKENSPKKIYAPINKNCVSKMEIMGTQKSCLSHIVHNFFLQLFSN